MELKFQNFKIRMDFSFPAMLLMLFMQTDNQVIRQSLLVCLIHELGHGLAICLTNAGIREIRFYAAGIRMETASGLLRTGQVLVICLSGPLMNLFCAVLYWKISPETAAVHLGMGMFNLFPFRILDGGAAIECLFENRAEILQIRKIFCIMLSAVSIFLLYCWNFENPALYLMAGFLAISEFAVDKQHPLW